MGLFAFWLLLGAMVVALGLFLFMVLVLLVPGALRGIFAERRSVIE